MNKARQLLSMVAILVLASIPVFAARAQALEPEIAAEAAKPRSSSQVKRDFSWAPSTIPTRLKYHELNQAQKLLLNRAYEHIAEGDEPPYPKEGLRPVFAALQKGHELLSAQGKLILIVDVDEAGTATSVRAIGSPSPEMTKFASAVLGLTAFKPSMCGGTPCKMQYPFCIIFE